MGSVVLVAVWVSKIYRVEFISYEVGRFLGRFRRGYYDLVGVGGEVILRRFFYFVFLKGLIRLCNRLLWELYLGDDVN